MSIWTRRLSIRWIAPLTIGGLVLAVATVLGWLAVGQGQQNARQVTNATMDEVQERIHTRLDWILGIPARINRINVQLLDEGKLDPSDLRAWQRVMFAQIEAFPQLSSVCWGDEEGRATWIARYSDRKGIDYAIKDDTTDGKIHEYFYTVDGGITPDPKAMYAYDPHVRLWYQSPKERGTPGWSAPFRWINKDGATADLGISFAQSYPAAPRKMIGVIDAEITFHDLSSFLHALEIGLSRIRVHRRSPGAAPRDIARSGRCRRRARARRRRGVR